ncbi:PREDICTED: interleukin-11 receptor subunit alpha [Nanorana parkeri]|uniref:interleukin-11 receptor subunit alpha n=1 Tax=Nanorana parkeri TaxID=125878 RepID=UPI000854DB7B|nr:PREDICTED: interleukin-11 receptor subunit alpha [Nanorana parkeri]
MISLASCLSRVIVLVAVVAISASVVPSHTWEEEGVVYGRIGDAITLKCGGHNGSSVAEWKFNGSPDIPWGFYTNTEPIAASDSSEPSDSSELSDSSTASDSSEPSDSSTASDSSAPSVPIDSSEPSAPSDFTVPRVPCYSSVPSVPSAPSDSIAPSVPIDSSKPSDSIAPSIPIDSSKPSDSIAPSVPIDSSKPSDSIAPSVPIDSSKPSDSIAPSVPIDSSKPSDSIAPSVPIDSSKPSDSIAPSVPIDSSKPSALSNSSEPSVPSDFMVPRVPSYSSVPSDSSAPSHSIAPSVSIDSKRIKSAVFARAGGDLLRMMGRVYVDVMRVAPSRSVHGLVSEDNILQRLIAGCRAQPMRAGSTRSGLSTVTSSSPPALADNIAGASSPDHTFCALRTLLANPLILRHFPSVADLPGIPSVTCRASDYHNFSCYWKPSVETLLPTRYVTSYRVNEGTPEVCVQDPALPNMCSVRHSRLWTSYRMNITEINPLGFNFRILEFNVQSIVKPDPPEKISVEPIPFAPQRLLVTWAYPTTWPQEPHFQLRFRIQYRPVLHMVWSVVETANLSDIITDAFGGVEHILQVSARDFLDAGNWSEWSAEARATPWTSKEHSVPVPETSNETTIEEPDPEIREPFELCCPPDHSDPAEKVAVLISLGAVFDILTHVHNWLLEAELCCPPDHSDPAEKVAVLISLGVFAFVVLALFLIAGAFIWMRVSRTVKYGGMKADFLTAIHMKALPKTQIL